MKQSIAWVLAAVVAAGAAGFYFWKARTDPSRAAVQVPVQEGAIAEPPAQAGTEPAIRHPVPTVDAGGEPLPPLQASDTTIAQAVAGVLQSPDITNILVSEDLVRRIVATVDNLPRKRVAPRILPVKRPDGQVLVAEQADSLTLSERNHNRYTAYVKLARATDVPRLVALYVKHYPLFQQAYEELGYPQKYFNDRLIEAIDEMLFTPDAQQPVRLVQPKVLYEFAEPELESLSAGQKIMIRMGPENAAVITAKLREIRRELVTESPARAQAPR